MHQQTYSGALAFLLLGVLAGPAWADEVPAEESAIQEARALADAARERRAAGDAQGALRLYQQAYRIHPTPYLHWPQAELLLELGQPMEGLAALRSHQGAFAPDDLPAGQGIAEIKALEERLNAKIGRLMVLTDQVWKFGDSSHFLTFGPAIQK